MSEIKHPPAIDVSHWNLIPNWETIVPAPYLAIAKASEGIAYVDTTFRKNMEGMLKAGCHRGAYHFHRRVHGGTDQAKHFLNVIDGLVDDKTLLVLDVEEGEEKASGLWYFFETVRAHRPKNRLMLYSRKNILEDIFLTPGEKDYFKKIPTWIAGYPNNPAMYDETPSFYIPDPSSWGPVYLWQYSEHGQMAGIEGDVDLNWVHPNLQLFLGRPPEPPAGNGGNNMSQWYRVTTNVLNLRSSPVVQTNPSNDIGDLFQGDRIETTTTSGSWARVIKIIRANGGAVYVPTVETWANVSTAYCTPIAPPELEPNNFPAEIGVTIGGVTKPYVPKA